MGLGCLCRGFLLERGTREGAGGEEVMLRKRFGLVLVPGLGETSRGAARVPSGWGGRRGVLSHR